MHLLPNAIACSAAISACEKSGQWQQALASFFSACEKCQQRQQALGPLTETRIMKLLPNVFTYNAATSACEKSERWQQALSLLAERVSQNLPEAARNVSPESDHIGSASCIFGGLAVCSIQRELSIMTWR
jgi:hypothetical protein